MKRRICCILLIVLMISVLPMNCFAAENGEEYVVAYFDDGSYMTEQISVVQTRTSGTVSGSKTSTYYADDGSISWKVVLKGTFTYTGTSATCTSSSCDATINESGWYVISKSASKSGNTATASATMGYKMLGVTVKEVPVSLKLTCDANGNLS